MRKILILFILTLLFSCDNRIKKISTHYYSINVEELSEFDDGIVPIISIRRNSFFRASVFKSGHYHGENRFIYSWNEEDHFFKGNDLEIVFVRHKYSDKYLTIPVNTIIGIKQFDNGLKAFFINWQNKPVSIDSNNIPTFEWEISSYTDSLFTNLDKNVIMDLFPGFKGNYKMIKEDSIVANYDYSFLSFKFFNNIRFKNHIVGYTWFRSVTER